MEKCNNKSSIIYNLEFDHYSFNDKIWQRDTYLNLINIFSDSKFNLCLLNNKDSDFLDKQISQNNSNKLKSMLRYTFKKGCFYFLFHDMNGNLYLGIQNEKQMIDLNLKLNSSLELNDIKVLNDFLQNKFFFESNNFHVYRDKINKFYFESLIDIIIVNWEIATIKIDDMVIIVADIKID